MSITTPEKLNSILYFLHGLPNVYDEERYGKLESYLSRTFDSEKLASYYEAAKWVTEHKDLDLKTVGIGDTLRQTNEDIHFFVSKLKGILEELIETAE